MYVEAVLFWSTAAARKLESDGAGHPWTGGGDELSEVRMSQRILHIMEHTDLSTAVVVKHAQRAESMQRTAPI